MTASLPPTPPPRAGEPDWEKLARLVAGELPAEEAAAVRARVNADPALARLLGAVEASDFRTGDRAASDVEAALIRVRLRMKQASRPNSIRFLLPLAAAIVAVAGVFLLSRSGTPDNTVVATAAPQVYRTTTGARDSITLADGSKVVLGPGSELSVPSDFLQTRHVTLKGQARFDVVHDDTRLFTVHTAQAVVTDLGTVFTVKDFDGSAVDVTVQSGSVRLTRAGSADTGVVLTAGDAGAIDTRGVLSRETRAASDEDLAWMSGRLVFREAPLFKVRAELRRWYGVELVTTDSAIAKQLLTASFRDETVSQMVEIIALSIGGAKYEIRGDTIVLQAVRR